MAKQQRRRTKGADWLLRSTRVRETETGLSRIFCRLDFARRLVSLRGVFALLLTC